MDVLALALISGGLDSILAAKMLSKQPGLRVVGYHFRHLFEPGARDDGLSPAEHAAFEAGISIIEDSDDRGFLDMVISPKLGRGKGANPCRDCRVFILKKAEETMRKVGAKFLITGEVIGQRPMSQMRNYINQIEKTAGLRGYIVRPLSGKLFPPTIPEENGWINRDSLLDLSGRSRTPQMELAEKYDIEDYPSPAGGCLLTQKAYSERFFNVLEHEGDVSPMDIKLIGSGRFYRLGDGLRIIIPRTGEESRRVRDMTHRKAWVIYADGIPGPFSTLSREPIGCEKEEAASLVAAYGKASGRKIAPMVIESPSGKKERIAVEPANKRDFRQYLIT